MKIQRPGRSNTLGRDAGLLQAAPSYSLWRLRPSVQLIARARGLLDPDEQQPLYHLLEGLTATVTVVDQCDVIE
jgi:hypothetical protein